MNIVLLWSLWVSVGRSPVPRTLAHDTTAASVLHRQTQELLDAVSRGDTAPWRRYLHERVVFTDENGTRLDRAQLIAQTAPLPPDVGGSITATDFAVEFFGNVAVATYVDDEHERFHGQELHALYRTTDTWIKDGTDWKMIASQVLALQQDPPAITLSSQLLDAYVGRYSLAPDYVYSISRDSLGLVGRVNEGRPQRLLAEAGDVLFVPAQPRTRKLFRRNADGEITGFVSRREGRDLVFVRLP